ncbi:hypothetical protein [Aeromonas phage AS-szw]|uniref:Uncharacterized protein n=1 Tax=Aeromonas phage AS-szw TaxID=2026114 RepID=A0A291LE68_9CAUD|nr:hypothetical protein [Aeromonas phage AS-szw]
MEINLSSFSPYTPKTPGTYLWNSGTDKKPDVRSIHVVIFPKKTQYGIDWDSYLGVPSMGGRHVGHLKGSFLKLEFV